MSGSAGDGREACFPTDGGVRRGFELATLATLQQVPLLSVSHLSPSCPWHVLLNNGQNNQNLNSSSAVSMGTSVECEQTVTKDSNPAVRGQRDNKNIQ